MSKLLLYRLERMVENPAEEKITPGLKAAACLHSITRHERDPKKFPASERQLADLAGFSTSATVSCALPSL